MKNSVRTGYEKLGVEGYYKKHSEDYSNPHIKEVEYLIKIADKQGYIGSTILDLCCGSGEVTKIIENLDKNNKYNIEGLDPFTAPAYKKNTNKECLVYSFKDIATGALKNKRYDTIICSFALHLCEISLLNTVLYQLNLITNTLIIITPHKRPEIKSWWKEVYTYKYNRVTLKVYNKMEFENE